MLRYNFVISIIHDQKIILQILLNFKSQFTSKKPQVGSSILRTVSTPIGTSPSPDSAHCVAKMNTQHIEALTLFWIHIENVFDIANCQLYVKLFNLPNPLLLQYFLQTLHINLYIENEKI